jgi:hypothetical protein
VLNQCGRRHVLLVQGRTLAFLLATFPPSFIQRCHITGEQWLASLGIDHIVLLTEPYTQVFATRCLDGMLLETLLKISRAPSAWIEASQSFHEPLHVLLIAIAWCVGIPRRLSKCAIAQNQQRSEMQHETKIVFRSL